MRLLVTASLLAVSLVSTTAFAGPRGGGKDVDARGYKVVSSPATAPAGANQPFTPSPGAQIVVDPAKQAAVFTPQPADGTAPPCTKTVTDRCVQDYRGGGGK
ncbi:hypothetical protein [Flavisphingomonas formosensis]|uniref:hypothetical protein n=1 Tax=Flavisphingomonas formosensis TaxID=861534 RepID=UPI0012FB71FD|nr:hypothetical protein [Sphingomonas formosensis]